MGAYTPWMRSLLDRMKELYNKPNAKTIAEALPELGEGGGGSGLPAVTDSDAEKTLLVDEEGNWEVDYAPPNWLVCTWTRTVNGNSVSWSCDRTYNQMIANRNILNRQVIFQFEDRSAIATFHHESGASDYFAGEFIVKLNGQYSKVTLYCISGLGVTATEERIVQDNVETVSGTTPTIVPVPDTTYKCGEVASLTISSFPAQGKFVIWFTSGSTPTTTVGIANFTAEANKRYRITVEDGCATYDAWTVGGGE